VLFAVSGLRGSAWLGALAGELATIGAVADVAENVNTLQLLRVTGGSPSDSNPARVVKTMRLSTVVKWFSLLAAAGLLSVMFFERGGWSVALGLLYAASAALGAAAIGADAARLRVPDVWLE